MSTNTVTNSTLSAARKRDEMLEPYEWKRSRTVLRREGASNRPDLVDYGSLVERLGGSVIHIASGGKDHINPLDMVEGYGEGNDSVSEKSEFMMALFEQLAKGAISGKQFSLIDRCTGRLYENYQHGGPLPTLISFRDLLLEQSEPDAQELALILEAYSTGNLDVFAHATNVDANNRVVVYDILGLGEQLKTLGLLVVTDAILNRVTENWKKGIRTHIILDEFHGAATRCCI